jgi:3-oxoadipate enol-lactonase/4-carboxymuconolactone decarboxylase
MPLATIDGLVCHYRIDGADAAPVLILAHSLGLDYGMWDAQAADCSRYFRVVRYDLRGHGASGAPSGDYSVEQLGRDALALADALGLSRFAFCGVSIGGMAGQWLGVHAPERLTRLVLANSSPHPDPASLEARRRAVLDDGMAAAEASAMSRFFSPAVLDANPDVVVWARRTLRGTNPVGYAGACAAARDFDMRERLAEIRVPTLVICGSLDASMPWAGHGALLAERIPDATVVQLRAAHLSNLEQPRSFTASLLRFLRPAGEDPLAEGMAIRRAVLGDAHVDRAMRGTTPFTESFQELLTRYAWGTIWSRPGLDRRTRRLLVIAMTAAMGRWEEYRLHVRAGLAAGLEPCDLEEVLLQVAIYAGVPAANTAFHLAAAELEQTRPAMEPAAGAVPDDR